MKIVEPYQVLDGNDKPIELGDSITILSDSGHALFNITLDDNELYINSGNVSKHNGVTLDDTFTIKPVAANAIRLVKPEYKSNITRK